MKNFTAFFFVFIVWCSAREAIIGMTSHAMRAAISDSAVTVAVHTLPEPASQPCLPSSVQPFLYWPQWPDYRLYPADPNNDKSHPIFAP